LELESVMVLRSRKRAIVRAARVSCLWGRRWWPRSGAGTRSSRVITVVASFTSHRRQNRSRRMQRRHSRTLR